MQRGDRVVAAVNRGRQSTLLLVTGIAVVRISLFSDLYLRYVKDGLRPLLIASGVLLIAAGLVGGLRDVRPLRWGRRGGRTVPAATSDAPQGHEHGHEHGHSHAHGPRVAWLVALPVLALLLFPPPALGSYSAARDNPVAVEEISRFDPLPASGPVPLSLTEFIARVQQDRRESLKGRTVVMEGFVTPGPHGTWSLTRLLLACCAADSQSLKIAVHGAAAPPADTWVRVTGTWHPHGTLGTPSAALALDAAAHRRIPEPPAPYRDRAPE